MSWNKTHSKALEQKVARIKSANQELREQLKAKDEEIEMLQCRLYHAEGYIKDIHKPKEQ